MSEDESPDGARIGRGRKSETGCGGSRTTQSRAEFLSEGPYAKNSVTALAFTSSRG